jgi:GTP cyclohydrolase I
MANGKRRDGRGGTSRGRDARTGPTRSAPSRLGAGLPRRAPVESGPADEGFDLDPAPGRNPEFEGLVRRMLELLQEDPERDGLRRTPRRVANAFTWLTRGYDVDVEDVVGGAVFEETHESMVMVRDIELYSLCEHHLLPFFGRAHVAYIPDGRIVGLSKLPRIVEVFARRLQVQERLTEQIAQAIQDVLAPQGVGVVIEAYHLCMMMRGVEKQNSKTITSAVRGIFRSDARTREEFLALAHDGGSLLR